MTMMTKFTGICHCNKQRSSIWRPFVYTVELFACSRKKPGSKYGRNRGKQRSIARKSSMRCSDSIEIDRCDIVEEARMIQNTGLSLRTHRRTESMIDSHPIRYRATKPPRLYPVTEKRMTRSPLHSISLTASVTL
jgi:hypothetical protein